MNRLPRLRYQLTFITFIRPEIVVRFAAYFLDVDSRYAARALLVALSSLAGQPLRLLEWLFYGRRIARTPIEQPPIFILGHWRSGTTHLHNLFSQDPAFGYVSMYQVSMPDFSLIGRGWLKRILARVLPVKRPMDNMTWPVESPQEGEIALAKTCAYSFYAQFLFPRRSMELFRRTVLLEGAPSGAACDLKAKLRRLLQIATIHAQGRRLVLKNPVNTARVRLLLELFPDAKFIHIHRRPYDIFPSTKNLRSRLMSFTSLQELDGGNEGATVLSLYEAMMRRFLADRHLIPRGNLCEVRFEDLERDPLGEMRRPYGELGLESFANAEPLLRRYIEGQASYRKDRFELSPADRDQVTRRWSFAFRELAYPTEP